jgi:hypothetical protein
LGITPPSFLKRVCTNEEVFNRKARERAKTDKERLQESLKKIEESSYGDLSNARFSPYDEEAPEFDMLFTKANAAAYKALKEEHGKDVADMIITSPLGRRAAYKLNRSLFRNIKATPDRYA